MKYLSSILYSTNSASHSCLCKIYYSVIWEHNWTILKVHLGLVCISSTHVTLSCHSVLLLWRVMLLVLLLCRITLSCSVMSCYLFCYLIMLLCLVTLPCYSVMSCYFFYFVTLLCCVTLHHYFIALLCRVTLISRILIIHLTNWVLKTIIHKQIFWPGFYF